MFYQRLSWDRSAMAQQIMYALWTADLFWKPNHDPSPLSTQYNVILSSLKSISFDLLQNGTGTSEQVFNIFHHMILHFRIADEDRKKWEFLLQLFILFSLN